ncbi:MAG: AAA family ATPase, partial [Campylobacteraceae bacterium]
HKTDKEDILAKEYFRTRIWETIVLENSSIGEIQSYIEKKLLFHNKFEFISIFKDNYKLICKLTEGNFRTTNNLCYKIFEIYEYYEDYKPSILNQSGINKKIIEMAAISIGLINA